MRLYIDKDNIQSLVKGASKNLDLYRTLVRYVKNGLNVHYNFDLKDVTGSVNAWFLAVYGDGVKTDYVFSPPENLFPKRPFQTLEDFDSNAYRSIYLLNINNEDAKRIQDKQSILLGKVGEEYDIINKLHELEDKEIISEDIKQWGSYIPDFPLTDIILCDPYYFSKKTTYKKNKNEILTSLCHPYMDQINIVIITKEKDDGIFLDRECNEIKEQLVNAFNLNNNNCNVTIVKINGNFSFHSRHLITNYYRVIHTSGFLLKDSGLKPDVNTDIAPCTKWTANIVTNRLLALFQKIINRLDDPTYVNPPEIFGDKKSNFLYF